jgi:thiol-disulfide isomerase/thioredoxin
MGQRLRAGVVVFAGFFAGCAQSGSGPADSPPVVDSTPVAPAPAGSSGLAPADIQLVTGDEKKLAEMIAAHKGHVVFVDYWATWCEPCVEYFPHTVEMHKARHKDGLRTISVTFDFPDDEPAVREFLASHGADFENILSSYPQGSEAFVGFDLDLVPTFRLYDRKGVKRYEWTKKPDDADEKISELLAEPAE